MLTGFSDENNYVREVGYESPLPVTTSYSGRKATKTVTYVAATTGAVGAHTLFTVTGEVFIKIFGVCTVDVTGSGTNEVGVVGNTAALIAQTTGTAIDAGEIWYNNTPVVGTTAVTNITERLIVGGADIIETIGTDTLTGGSVTYYAYWTPLSNGSSVVAA
jgi:hypothetical protein